MVERALWQLALTADAIHDLKVLLAGRDIGYEIEEVVGLASEAQRVKAPQHEGAVADPCVAIVPVALAADRLRQRGGGRREQGTGRAVRKALERERAALEVALPRMLGKLAAVDPFPPEVGGALRSEER